MLILIHLFVILFGLVIGSFLNVCIHRIPRSQSIVRPRSHCPHCNHLIRPWENVPILSFLFLRGKCSKCKAAISWVYPLIEFLTAVGFYLLFLKYGLTAPFWINAAFFSALIILIFIDLFHRILPDVITLGGTIAGLLLSPLQSPEFLLGPFGFDPSGPMSRPLNSMLGIALGAGILWLTARFYLAWRKVEGMGFGDIKMMAMVGAFLGPTFAFLTIFLGSLSGAVVGMAFIRLARKDRRYELPFGTFLGFGAIVSVLWGSRLITWYLGLAS